MPWDVRIACGFLVGPEHPKSRTTIDRRVYDLVPIKWKFSLETEDYFCSKIESLSSSHDKIRPVDMNTRLDETVGNWSRPGSGNQALRGGPKGTVNYRTKLQEIIICQLFGSLVVQVNKELEALRLLLDHVQFCS